MIGGDDVQRHLVSSELYKEDVLESDHTTVWGSFYDATQSRWGYACCRATRRRQPCEQRARDLAAKQASVEARAGSEDDSEEDSESEQKPQEKPVEWGGPPMQLLSRQEVEGGRAEAFVEHFVRFAMGAWQRVLESPDSQALNTIGLSDPELEAFRSLQSLQQAEASLEPLIEQLGHGAVNARVLESFVKMASLAVDREYGEAGKVYMDLVLGHKKWNNVYSNFQSMNTNKGARMKIIAQSDLTTYDSDPVAQRYIHSVRKLVQIAQIVRPNPDLSKHLRN